MSALIAWEIFCAGAIVVIFGIMKRERKEDGKR